MSRETSVTNTNPNQEPIRQPWKMPTRLSPCRLVVRVYGAKAERMGDLRRSITMKITITKVLKNEVTICGQAQTREYVENIMLPMLVAQCGTVRGRQFEIVQAFDEAGLSLQAIPDVAREYRQDRHEKAQEKARQQAEADAHAERCREWSPREIAQAKREREDRAVAIREHGALIRTASRRNAGW